MMTNKLENICVNKVRVERKAYIEEYEKLCKYGCEGYNTSCLMYMSMKQAQEPFKRGINARLYFNQLR